MEREKLIEREREREREPTSCNEQNKASHPRQGPLDPGFVNKPREQRPGESRASGSREFRLPRAVDSRQ